MPRRDGFPTNREMVVEFNDLSRTAYVDAFQRLAEDGLPDAFQDKPLGLMYLDAAKRIPSFMRLDDSAVVDERLTVTPLDKLDVDDMEYTLGFKDTPDDVRQHYYDVARRIGETTLHGGLDIAAVLPGEGVVADYTARYPSGRTRHIATFKEKPSKPSIAAGKYFAEQVIKEANRPFEDTHFDLADFEKAIAAMKHLADQGGIISHSFSFLKVPGLPLNGHESKAFLNAYANAMFDRSMILAARLDKMSGLGIYPEAIIEGTQTQYDQANRSYQRAQELLDKQ